MAPYADLRCKQATHAFEIFRRVYTGAGGAIGDVHGDRMAMPQRTQLLQ